MAHKSMGSEAATALARTFPGPRNPESDPVATANETAPTAPQHAGASPTQDTIPEAAPTEPGPTSAELTGADLTRVLTRVRTASIPSSAAALFSLLKVLTLLINALTCFQARVQAGLLQARRQEAQDAGRPVRPVRGAVTQEIGIACRLSPYKAAEHLKRGLTLPERLPATWAQWQAGEISAERATTVARETRPLDPDQAGRVDADIAPDLGLRSRKEAEYLVRRAVTEADPQAAAERARMAQEDRYASARPAGDGMITVNALIPGMEGQAIWTGLEQRAGLIRGAGDDRSKEQIKADLFCEALISYLAYLDQSDSGPAVTGQQPKRPRPSVQIQLVMTDAALFGFSDTTARVHGLGPVPAPLARTWAREAMEDEQAELVRLYTAAGTGKLVAMDSKRRTFPKSLARYVITRDDICRTPWCGAPVRHIDHVTPHSSGGPTALTNAAGLCVQCNEHKDGPGWHHTAGEHGAVTVTSPTGDTYTTHPAPLPHERMVPCA